MSVGPLCPVEPCGQPIGIDYSSRDLVLMQPGGVRITVPLNADGSFQADVPAGTYDAFLDHCEFLGCDHTFPVRITVVSSETTTHTIDVDTGIRSPDVRPADPISALAQELRDASATVEPGETAQSFFSLPGRVMRVNGEHVLGFAYPSTEMAEADAATVSPGGGTIGFTSVLWAEPAHFFQRDTLIALYVGRDTTVVALLTDALGSHFAGGVPVSRPDVPALPEAADLAARAALAERLGVSTDDLLLVREAEVEFSDTALGCPQPGAAYAQVIVPGYELLYEHGRVRYQYNVSRDGTQLTDCIGAGAEALPFRVSRRVISVHDAFELIERQEALAAEIVLRSAEEAAAYVAAHPGAISIHVGAIDWSVQLVAGLVATGTGCTFITEITGVRANHLNATVDIAAHAEQSGMCEKFGAVARWVILNGVPADYTVSFILSSFGPPPCCKP